MLCSLPAVCLYLPEIHEQSNCSASHDYYTDRAVAWINRSALMVYSTCLCISG